VSFFPSIRSTWIKAKYTIDIKRTRISGYELNVWFHCFLNQISSLTGTSPFGLIFLCSSVDYKSKTKIHSTTYTKLLQLLLSINQPIEFDNQYFSNLKLINKNRLIKLTAPQNTYQFELDMNMNYENTNTILSIIQTSQFH
jgi:hypothetical protein